MLSRQVPYFPIFSIHAFRHVVNMEIAGGIKKLQNNNKLSEATNEATDWRTFYSRDCFFPFPTIDTEE